MKVELLTASACLEYASSEIYKSQRYKIPFFYVYKLNTYLVLLAKSHPLQ